MEFTISAAAAERLNAFMEKEKLRDPSAALDRLLVLQGQSDAFRRRQQRTQTLLWLCKWLLRILCILFSFWAAYQIYYLLYFPAMQTPAPRSSHRGRVLFYGDPQIEGFDRVKRQGVFGEIQNAYNDLYMKWIFWRTVSVTAPNMVVLLGDLVSSQHISNYEFQQRAERLKWIFELPSGRRRVHISWLAGNHDIGYGSDCNERRISRFEEIFGPQNEVTDYLDHRWVKFNSQVIEGARAEILQNQTYEFVVRAGADYMALPPEEQKPLIFLDHIPFHKPEGKCADAPSISKDEDGYIRSQNMLSSRITTELLQFAPVLIFNGHDHNGCYYEHPLTDAPPAKEVTVRSMMGDYGGYGALLDITSHNPEAPLRERFQYNLYAIEFQTTNAVVTKLIVGGIWLALVVLQFMACGLSCCINRCRRRRRQSNGVDQTSNGVVTKLVVGGIWLVMVTLRLIMYGLTVCINCCRQILQSKKAKKE